MTETITHEWNLFDFLCWEVGFITIGTIIGSCMIFGVLFLFGISAQDVVMFLVNSR